MMRVGVALLLSLVLSASAWAQQRLVQGSITAQNGAVIAQPGLNMGSLTVQVTGTWTGTLTFEGSADNVTFVSLVGTNITSSASSSTTTANGVFSVGNPGLTFLRVRSSAAQTGTAVVTINAGPSGGGAVGGGGASGSVTQGTSPWIVAGGGTAGSAATGVVTVQGITSMTPLLAVGTGTAGAAAAGVMTVQGIASGTAVTVAPSSGTFATDQTFGTSTYTEATTTGPLVGMVRTDTPAALANTTNEVAPLSGSALGGVYTASASNPCEARAWTTLAISAAADAVLIAASASNRTYICEGAIIANSAEIFALWEGTGSTCGTGTAALVGSTTIGNGVSLAANGGFPLKMIKTAGTNVDVCLHLNTTNRVTGYVSYVQAP